MSSYLFNRYTLVSVGIVVVAVSYYYYYSGNQNNGITNPIRQHLLFGDMRRSAVVIGGTGATGTTLVNQLLKSKEWGKITIIHRRELDISQMNLTMDESSKLTQHIVDMAQLLTDTNIELFKGHDVTFCTLGTTRGNAGSADNWRKVDIEMVKDSAFASKKAGIPHFSLLTSKGANANLWANDWTISHPLLYAKSKGVVENQVINMNFKRTSIFRPGLLLRGNFARWEEKLVGYVMGGTTVQNVARAMIYDAESSSISDSNSPIEKPVIYEEKDIQFLSKL